MTTNGQNTQRIVIVIADLAVALATDDVAVIRRLHHRYREFLGETEIPHLSIDLRIVPGAQFIDFTPGPWIIEFEYDDNQLKYLSYRERGEVNLHTGRGWLEIAPDAPVENFLRVVYAWLCVTHGDLLLHAAGVVRHEEGYIFFGPSGAGKSTSSRLSASTAQILSDDLVIIRRNGDGSAYRLYGVPFRGEFADAPRINRQAPLKGIFRLIKDTAHFVEPLPFTTAIAELMAASPFVVREAGLANRLMAVCDQIAHNVPVHALHFRRDDGFWKVIDEFYATHPPAASSNGR